MAEGFIYGQSGGLQADYSNMPYTDELDGLFELDSLDLSNSLWINKITNQNNFTIVGGTEYDNALCLNNGEYGYCSAETHPYVLYLVVKKSQLEENKFLFGISATSDGFSMWNNGNKQGSFIEFASFNSNVYYYAEDLNKYYTVSIMFTPTHNTTTNNSLGSSIALCFINGEYCGCTAIYTNMSLNKGYNEFLNRITLNARLKTNNLSNISSGCVHPTYIRALAFGKEQTVEQVVENSKYLYKKYCEEN